MNTEPANLLPFDGTLHYLEDVFAPQHSMNLFAKIHKETHWQERKIKIFGREVTQPRLVLWVGDPGCLYRYSGTTLSPENWTPGLLSLKQKIEDLTKSTYNSALLNLYRNEKDSMGAHSDDEKELGHQPTIASLSLGETRKIFFRHKTKKDKVVINLESGSLLTMRGSTQKHWKHEVPKTKTSKGPRINITFRKIIF